MMTEAQGDADKDAAVLLMARLSSQFSDLDLERLNLSLQGNYSPAKSNLRCNDGSRDTDAVPFPEDEADDDGDSVAPSEESSLAEPTPEELAAWQAQQFQKGKETLQRQKEENMDPIQKRRLALRNNGKIKNRISRPVGDDVQGDDDNDDWEEIAALPDLQGQSSIFFNTEQCDGVVVGVSPLLRILATSPKGDPELLGTAWRRLFSSVEGSGLSFFNLCHEICQYDGPTLMLLGVVPSKSKMVVSKIATHNAAATIGFYTTATWQESSEYHGNFSKDDAAFLFAMDELENRVEFFGMQEASSRKVESRTGYMYCHPSTKSTKRRGGNNYHHDSSDKNKKKFFEKTDGAVHGIGIGGRPNQPRLHLTETLEECRCLTYDTNRTFEDGNLFLNNPAFEDSLYYFDVETIEVWGVGGESWIRDALLAREKSRGIAASNLQQRRRIYDKSQVLDDFRNGLHSTTTKSAANGSYFDHVLYTSDRCDV